MNGLKRAVIALSVAPLMCGAGLQPSMAAKTCPAFKVSATLGEPDSGQVYFKISPAPDGLAFNWSVSAGMISSGQGTSEIVAQVPSGEPVTALVGVIGLDPSCPAEASGQAKAP